MHCEHAPRTSAAYSLLSTIVIVFTNLLAMPVFGQIVDVDSKSGCGGISGSMGWQATGITVDTQNSITICATGGIQLNDQSSNITGPQGETGEGPAGAGWCDPNAFKGELLATSGGAIFRVGAGATITFDVAGALFLGINDEFYDDNAGSFLVAVRSGESAEFTFAGVSTGMPYAFGLGRAAGGMFESVPINGDSLTFVMPALPVGSGPGAFNSAITNAINNGPLFPCIRATQPYGDMPGTMVLRGPANVMWFSPPGTTMLGCNTATGGLFPLPGYPVVGTCDFNPTAYQVDVDLLSMPTPTDAALLEEPQNTLQGDGIVIATYDFEGGSCDPQGWTSVDLTDSYGDYAHLTTELIDQDPCADNESCKWAFFDDPNTTFDCQVPGQGAIPEGTPEGEYLHNEVRSPLIDLAAYPAVSAFRISYDVYRDMELGELVSYSWRVRFVQQDADGLWRGIGGLIGTDGWSRDTWTIVRDTGATHMQLALGVRDDCDKWCSQVVTASCHGPGPVFDNIVIEGLLNAGPVLTAALGTQAQDAFPTQAVGGSTGNYEPSNDIFGSIAFSCGQDIAVPGAAQTVTGDSITIVVEDAIGAGGLDVRFFASIVAGPHAGKALPGTTPGANGFFEAPVQAGNGHYFVDLDDDYFRGGDELRYFWVATDAGGGFTSYPPGLLALPTSVAAAEAATGGILEVSFLPSINWDPAYLARIAADPHGKLEPTPTEIANSSPKNCMLYVQMVDTVRRSGDLNRTSFMASLDQLGYQGSYDVYDHTGLAGTWNHLSTRAAQAQVGHYALLVYDAGARAAGTPLLPDGSDVELRKTHMSDWLLDWLNLAGAPNQNHTLWMLGSNLAEEAQFDPLLTAGMATALQSDTYLDSNPNVFGVDDFTNHATCVQLHDNEQFALDARCPLKVGFDVVDAVGPAVVTHQYGQGFPDPSGGAVVMNNNALDYSTVMQSFPWNALAAGIGQNPTTIDIELLSKVLGCALPLSCQESVDPTDASDDLDDLENVPARTALYQNSPNPLNPTTRIAFDLAVSGRTRLTIYDVAGRQVRELIRNQVLEAGRYAYVWDGRFGTGARASAGIYFYRLQTEGGQDFKRKMVLVK